MAKAAPDQAEVAAEVLGEVEQLERLAALRASGALSEHEFIAAKQRLLGMDGDSGLAAHRLARGHAALQGEEHSVDQEAHYLFDLNGFVVVRGALSPAEVAAGNAAIDFHHARVRVPDTTKSPNAGTGMAGGQGRGSMGGLLSLPVPHRAAFTDLIAHPRIVPYLNEST